MPACWAEGGSSFACFEICDGRKRGWSPLRGSHFPTVTEAATSPAGAQPVSSALPMASSAHSQNHCLGSGSGRSRGVRRSSEADSARGALSHPPPLQSNSSRRKLAPSPADTKVINRNLYPKAQLDQPGSPWPLSPHVCVCLEKHVNAAVGRGGPPLDLRVERSHHVLFHSSPVPERRP